MYSKMMLPIQLTKILYSHWEGTISISSQDSEIYGKCLEGPGSVTFKNGNRYEGNFHNGLLSGTGKFTWANGIVYEGQFTDNRITGQGIYLWPDGSRYEGEVKDGLRHGFGVYKIDDATYEGQWFEGKKEGKGKIIFKSGSIFEGQFKNDLKHGHGKMYYYPSGNFFEGEWGCDLKEGVGTMNWTDLREKYVGSWHKNLQHGWGVHIWLQSKGEGKFLRNRYEGNWANGVREGFGTFYYANGSKYQGYWKQNMKQGLAFYTNQNGKVSLIRFDKDRMIKNQAPQLQTVNGKKIASKKQVDPNAYSLCLRINHLFYPFESNLEPLYNFLLRNNSQLKGWYKGLANFYDQQSQLSFCLNLEGVWKMVRALKILGDFSLASLDRGLRDFNPEIETILNMLTEARDEVNYEEVYYQKASRNYEQIDLSNPEIKSNQIVQSPFREYKVHDRQKNLLFREFIHLLVWIAYSLNPRIDKPQKSVEQLLNRITPMLQTITKSVKIGTSQNISENMSSVSKGEKSISIHFKTANQALLDQLKPPQERVGRIMNDDLTIKLRQLIGFGRLSGTVGENQLALLERIVDKYMDPEITGRPKKDWWGNSSLSVKLLNIMNYQLIQYQFVEIIYFLMIKKLPSHKQTEENKKKYQEYVDTMSSSVEERDKKRKKQKQFGKEARYLKSKKAEGKKRMQAKRAAMQKALLERNEERLRLEREENERRLMGMEDKDIRDEEFDEEQSELSI